MGFWSMTRLHRGNGLHKFHILRHGKDHNYFCSTLTNQTTLSFALATLPLQDLVLVNQPSMEPLQQARLKPMHHRVLLPQPPQNLLVQI